ncbi:MAG: prolyl oligopeptidase family serine peptidase [Verrucomicrobiota bacterium]
MNRSLLPLIALALPCLAASSPDASPLSARTVKIAPKNAVKLQYWLHAPEGEGPHPLILFLHGKGERGSDLNSVKKHGPPKLIENDSMPSLRPFVVVSPQCPDDRMWQYPDLKALLDEVLAEQDIDRSRVYITGLSMGGFGTWKLLAEEPRFFAAAIPICGGGDPDWARRLKHTPIWAFHGDEDSVVPVDRSKEMVDGIRRAGGKKVKLTIYPEVKHDSWTATYNNPEIYAWLLSHSLGGRKGKD